MYKERTDNMKELFPEPLVLAGKNICLRPLALADAESLRRLTRQEAVYRYLPTFLFEKKYRDPKDVIVRLYEEGLKDSLILGIFQESGFCGLAEIYGYRAPIRKVSAGYRLLQEKWGKGIASEALGILVRELLENRGIEIITASTMVENQASARVLQKNRFTLVNRAVDEDWGYPEPTPADKWIR
ncbi:MAG: GNAT family N-acetyltransferase [Blautia sp.]|nr:GNAT family N-acetyltransferase [Blautia sp.]